MLPIPPPYIPPAPIVTTPHAPIMINGDANFSATALLGGWSGDGSPENPYIIDGLGIDLWDADAGMCCIVIENTRVSFTISNCNLTGAHCFSFGQGGDGIYLGNVTNGELVDNIIDNNHKGILLVGSDYNTVANNTCSSNDDGIALSGSHSNTVANNTCSSNDYGIALYESHSNTVSDNTCNYNRIGIYLQHSQSANNVVNNTCWRNTEYDILESMENRLEDYLRWGNFLMLITFVYYIDFIVIVVITLLGGLWIGVKGGSKEGN
jgi:parallel beta-helix repeat protein